MRQVLKLPVKIKTRTWIRVAEDAGRKLTAAGFAKQGMTPHFCQRGFKESELTEHALNLVDRIV